MNDHHYFWREDEHEPRELHIHERLDWARRHRAKTLLMASVVAGLCLAAAMFVSPL